MLIDSKKQKLSVGQIIEVASKEIKSKYPADKVKSAILAEISSEQTEAWTPAINNTLFIVHKSNKPRYGYFRALNADSANNYVENSKIFCNAAYKKGFDVLVTQFEDSTVLNIFKLISRNPVNSNMGYAARKTSSGGYQVTLVLGSPRGEQNE